MSVSSNLGDSVATFKAEADTLRAELATTGSKARYRELAIDLAELERRWKLSHGATDGITVASVRTFESVPQP